MRFSGLTSTMTKSDLPDSRPSHTLSGTSDCGPAARRPSWPKILASYRQPHRGRSTFELAVTVVPFALLWAVSATAVYYEVWWGLLLTIPAAGFLLRLFMIQHDCGHGAFFAHRHADDWIGRVLGVLTLTPYDYWRRAHAEHHASAGNLDERGVGDWIEGDGLGLKGEGPKTSQQKRSEAAGITTVWKRHEDGQ